LLLAHSYGLLADFVGLVEYPDVKACYIVAHRVITSSSMPVIFDAKLGLQKNFLAVFPLMEFPLYPSLCLSTINRFLCSTWSFCSADLDYHIFVSNW